MLFVTFSVVHYQTMCPYFIYFFISGHRKPWPRCCIRHYQPTGNRSRHLWKFHGTFRSCTFTFLSYELVPSRWFNFILSSQIFEKWWSYGHSFIYATRERGSSRNYFVSHQSHSCWYHQPIITWHLFRTSGRCDMYGAFVVHIERSHQCAADCFSSRFRVAGLKIRWISRLGPESAPTLKIAYKRVLCFLYIYIYIYNY